MDRVKLWLLPIYAVIGFIAILLAVPTSRWVVLTQLDVIAGRWKFINVSPDGTSQGDYLQPLEPGLTNDDPAPDETARFLRLVMPTGNMWKVPTIDQRILALYDICQAKNDVRYWAQLVRTGSFYAQVPYSNPGQKPFPLPNDPASEARIRDACLAGEKLEPDNAFFPMMRSGVLFRLGDLKGSREAYYRAAQCTNYDDYVLFEPETRYAYLVSHYGERGHQIKADIYDRTAFPHMSTLLSLGRYYTKPDDLLGRLATMRLGRTVILKTKSWIGIWMPRNIIALAFNSRMRVVQTQSKEVVSQVVHQFNAVPEAERTIREVADIYNAVPGPTPQLNKFGDAVSLILNLRTGFSAWSLWSLVMLPLAIGVAFVKARKERFAAAAPYLVWLMAIPIDPAFGSVHSDGTPFCSAALLFIPALFPSIRKYVDWLAIPIVVAAVIVSMHSFALGTPTILFVIALAMERRSSSIRWEITATGVLVACVLAAGYWVSLACRQGFDSGIVFGIPAAIGASAFIPVRAPVRWLPIVGASTLALGIWFGIMVAGDISVDSTLAAYSDNLLNDADQLRTGLKR